MPWIIGSLCVFGPAFVYLASPSARKSAPHVDKKHVDKHAPLQPMKDDEGTEVSGAELANSMHKAEATDVPKNADAKIPVAETNDTIKDDEGTEAPAQEVAKSVKQSVTEDAPKADGADNKAPSSEPKKTS